MRYTTRTSVALLAGTLPAGGARGARAGRTTAREAAPARKSARLAPSATPRSCATAPRQNAPRSRLRARTRRADALTYVPNDPSRAAAHGADLLTLTPTAPNALDPPPRPN